MKLTGTVLRKYIGLSVLVFFVPVLYSCRPHNYPDCISRPEVSGESGGCGNIFVYQLLDNQTAITVDIDRDIVKLTEKCKTFYLDKNPSGITVMLAVAGNNPDALYFNYCSDILLPDTEYISPTQWPCDRGTVTVSVSPGGTKPQKDSYEETYTVSMRLEGIQACSPDGTRRIIEEVIMWDITVGWVPG